MKGMRSILDSKNGEFDLSMAHVGYHFSLKYHRALSDFRRGGRDIATKKWQIMAFKVENFRNNQCTTEYQYSGQYSYECLSTCRWLRQVQVWVPGIITLELTSTSKVRVPEIQYSSTATTITE